MQCFEDEFLSWLKLRVPDGVLAMTVTIYSSPKDNLEQESSGQQNDKENKWPSEVIKVSKANQDGAG